MWFLLALFALSMQVTRRSSEKVVSSKISSLGMAWLQQAVALPFIALTLLFAHFYWPHELNGHYWQLMAAYVIAGAVDVYCYFKALSLADISFVAPLLSLTAVGNIVGSYFVLHQVPSWNGVLGACLLLTGASIVYAQKKKQGVKSRANVLAAGLVLVIVLLRSYYSNLEVMIVRQSNATTFNFYSSLLTVPFILLASLFIVASSRKQSLSGYWANIKEGVSKHRWLLLFIGLTYALNMWATYSAKLIAPSAGYVGAIKSSSALPLTIIGAVFLKEKVTPYQWFGVALIMVGLVSLCFG